MWTMNFQMFKLNLEKADPIAKIHWITIKAREFQKSIYFCFIAYASLWLCGPQQTGGNSLRDVNTRSPDLPLEKSVFLNAGQEATVRMGRGTISSVQFSRSVVYNSLRHHESQHSRPPCPSLTPRVYANSCPSSQWCHPAISSSVIPFSSCPQSLPASGSFPMSQLFASGDQSTGVSASASVLPINTQDWSPLGWTGWISLQSKGLSRVFSNTTIQKHQFFGTQLSSQSNSHIHTWPLKKP